MQVVVIGAGIVGASIAYELAKAGAKVTVVEASRLAGGSSTASFAWTNATGKRPHSYFKLNLEGMRAHQQLAREFGEAPWYHETGSLEWWTSAQGKADQIENFDQMLAWGYQAEWVDLTRLGELEPDIDRAAIGNAPIVHFPEEGWVDPATYVAWLLRAASSRFSVEVITGTRITGIESSSGRASAAMTAEGDRITADAVINCTGSWSSDRLDGVDAVPMASTVGVLAFTPPVATTLKRQFHAEDLDIRPDGAGRLMIHKVSVDRTVPQIGSLLPGGIEARTLLEAARAYLPALAAVEIESMRTTMRPITQDGFTCAGPMPGIEGYYSAVTHSGVSIAPYLARLMADEVLHGRVHDDLADFRPARLLSSKSAAISRNDDGRARKRGNEFA